MYASPMGVLLLKTGTLWGPRLRVYKIVFKNILELTLSETFFLCVLAFGVLLGFLMVSPA